VPVVSRTASAAVTIRPGVPRPAAIRSASGTCDGAAVPEVVVADLAAYERLLFETLLKLPNVADVRSNFALRTVKAAGPLPL
jgi:Lrp/AsnC family transcriptional regulator, leucine-responsive regulatory protein